jgi:hypothetical protein
MAASAVDFIIILDSFFILINQIGVLGAFRSAFGILVHFKEFTTQTRTSFIMLHLTY